MKQKQPLTWSPFHISSFWYFLKGRDSPFVRILSSSWFPDISVGKESTCNAGDLSLIPGLGRSLGEGKGYPLQYSVLENSMNNIVHGVARSQTQLSDFHFHFLSSWCFQILDIIPEFYLDCLLFLLSSCILLSTFLTYFFLILISMKPESVVVATEWEFLEHIWSGSNYFPIIWLSMQITRIWHFIKLICKLAHKLKG